MGPPRLSTSSICRPPPERMPRARRGGAVPRHVERTAARRDPVNPQCPAVAVHRRWRRLAADPRSPMELPVAANKGGGAEPMSEPIVALALAAAKRLFIEHANLKNGEFNQRSANQMLRGGVCGILGFGN